MHSHIMIVEDEQIVALDLKMLLEDLGHQVVADCRLWRRSAGRGDASQTRSGADGHSTGGSHARH